MLDVWSSLVGPCHTISRRCPGGCLIVVINISYYYRPHCRDTSRRGLPHSSVLPWKNKSNERVLKSEFWVLSVSTTVLYKQVWEKRHSATHRRPYFNSETGEKIWAPPLGLIEQSRKGQSRPQHQKRHDLYQHPPPHQHQHQHQGRGGRGAGVTTIMKPAGRIEGAMASWICFTALSA